MAMFIFDVNDVHLLPKLSHEQQQALLSTCSVEKPSYKAVANQLGVPVGTVKSRINRARIALSKLREVKV